MRSTAVRANQKTTCTIIFKNKEHEKFYQKYLSKCRYQDVYHKALVYYSIYSSESPFSFSLTGAEMIEIFLSFAPKLLFPKYFWHKFS